MRITEKHGEGLVVHVETPAEFLLYECGFTAGQMQAWAMQGTRMRLALQNHLKDSAPYGEPPELGGDPMPTEEGEDE